MTSSPEPPLGQLTQLEARVRQLEEALRRAGIPFEPAPAPPQPPFTAPAPAPFVPPSLAAAPPPQPSLESRIGSQWFNRIGILAVLVGMSWFLKLAIDRGWIGPAMRVLIGLAAGAAIFASSELFERRRYSAFSFSLKALGTGILYLSLWASFSLFHLVPSGVAFLGMVAVTALNGYLAWRKDSQLLALYGIVGGLSTPALLSTGRNEEVWLFSYLLLLDLALVALAAARPWARLILGAAAGTALYGSLWWLEYAGVSPAFTTAFFVVAFLLLFASVPRLLKLRDSTDASELLTLILVPPFAGALAFLALRDLLLSNHSDAAPPWLALLLAGLYFALSRIPARERVQPLTPAVSGTYRATATVFLTLAIGLRLHGRALTLAWLAEGAALVTLAVRGSSRLLRLLGVLTLLLGLAALLIHDPAASLAPVFNQRFATYAVAAALFGYVAMLAQRGREQDRPQDELPWRLIAPTSALLVNGLLLLALGREIHAFWWYVRWQGDWHLFHDYRMYAQFTYSALFMLFGAVLLVLGFLRDSAFLRWQALVLLAATIAKVFLVDLTALSEGYRILSFLGLGALLLAVSFIYQRDWLQLRNGRT